MIAALLTLAILAPAPAPGPCRPAPRLVIASDDADLAAFARRGLLRQTSENFSRAYANACRKGWLTRLWVGGRTIRLSNAPAANVASIYIPDLKDAPQPLFEYHFVRGVDMSVPRVAEIEEAIFCGAVGASVKEQQESGRCLPD